MMNKTNYSNGCPPCSSSEKIDEIHDRVCDIDKTLQGLVKDLIDEVRALNRSLIKAALYVVIGLAIVWTIDHFGIDKAGDFINKVTAEGKSK
mgnify:CR=1 FL=1